jgi:hypothetical protein
MDKATLWEGEDLAQFYKSYHQHGAGAWAKVSTRSMPGTRPAPGIL